MPFDPHRLHLFPDGRYIQFWRDPAKSMAEVAKFSNKDAQAYLRFEQQMDRLASIMKPSLELRPPLLVGEVEATVRRGRGVESVPRDHVRLDERLSGLAGSSRKK